MPNTRQRISGFDHENAAPSSLSQGIFQWSLVVPDLEHTLGQLRRAYSIRGFWILEDAPLLNVHAGDEALDVRVDIALGFMGDTNIEVIRPRAESGPSLYSDFLGERPEGGLHHFGFTVFDYDAAHNELAEQFGSNVLAGDFSTAGSRFAYFDSRSSTGLYTEILFLDPTTQGMMAALQAGYAPSID